MDGLTIECGTERELVQSIVKHSREELLIVAHEAGAESLKVENRLGALVQSFLEKSRRMTQLVLHITIHLLHELVCQCLKARRAGIPSTN